MDLEASRQRFPEGAGTFSSVDSTENDDTWLLLKKTQTTKQSVLSPGISPLFRVAKLHRVLLAAQVLLMLYKHPWCVTVWRHGLSSLEMASCPQANEGGGSRQVSERCGILWYTHFSLVKQHSGEWSGSDMWNFWDSSSQYFSQEILAQLALQFIWELQKAWMQ